MTGFVLVFVCVTWVIVSSFAVLLNQRIMVDLGFPYPILLTWMGVCATAALTLCMVLIGAVQPGSWMSLRRFSSQAMPCGFFMACAFVTGNTAYLHLTLPFIQMLKASTPVITLVMLLAAGMEKLDAKRAVSVSCIAVGVSLASYGELHATTTGIAIMLFSVASESLRLVLIQRLLVDVQPFMGVLYISLAASFWLFAMGLAWEAVPLLASSSFDKLLMFPGYFICAASNGFCVNVLAIIIIHMSSSLTLKIVGTCKDAMLVVFSVAVLHNQVTFVQVLGYSLAVTGFIAYTVHQPTSKVEDA